MNVLKILKKFEDQGFGFQVYGVGEFTADCEESTAAAAWPHIEGQDETVVYLWKDGISHGALNIMMEEGEADIYDWGGPESFSRLVDNMIGES